MMKNRDWRSRVLLLACLALAAISSPRAARAAAEDAADFIKPRLSWPQFSVLLQQLQADDDQRLILEVLFSDYAMAFEDLADDTDARAEAAGRERVEEALAGRAFVDPTELRQLRVAVLEAYRESWPQADQLLDDLLFGAASLLPEDERPRFDAALCDLRRAVYLHPLAAEGQDETYAGDGVDIIELVRQASISGAELESLDPNSLAAVLDDYERQIDELILATADADRAARMDRAIARIQRDKAEIRRLERGSLQRWLQLHQLNRATVNEVAAVAGQALGPGAKQRWLDRFDEACFPWLLKNTRPDKQRDWIDRHRLGESIKTRAAEIHREYAARRAELCREAIALMLRGRTASKIMLHSRMSPADLADATARELYQDLLKNSGKRAKLDDDTSASLEALLTDRQRNQMKADIAAAAYGRRR